MDYPPWFGYTKLDSDFGCLFLGHNGVSNYLFVDGHVKGLKPFATLDIADGGTSQYNMWRSDDRTFADAYGETAPTRPAQTLAACSSMYK